MLKIGDTVLYGATGVCTVCDVVTREIGGMTKEYFVLRPTAQDRCTVFVPTDNEALLQEARKILSKEEILGIIDSLPACDDLWEENEIKRRELFSDILHSGDRKRLMLLIRSLYNRREERRTENKRLHVADEHFMNEAERLLHDEFSAVLEINPEDVTDFIMKRLTR